MKSLKFICFTCTLGNVRTHTHTHTHTTFVYFPCEYVTYLRYTHVEIHLSYNNCTLVRLWYLTKYSVKIRIRSVKRIYCKNYQLGRKENNKFSRRTNENIRINIHGNSIIPFLTRFCTKLRYITRPLIPCKKVLYAYGFQLVFLRYGNLLHNSRLKIILPSVRIILSVWHFVRVTFCPCDILSVWHFVRVTLCPVIFRPGWYFVRVIFVQVIFCPGDILSRWHFVRWHFIRWHFVRWHFVRWHFFWTP